MGIPSCLWRRTGEIYKGNKEFAALVGVPIEQLREGKLAIYELMAEESAVNYWEVSLFPLLFPSRLEILIFCDLYRNMATLVFSLFISIESNSRINMQQIAFDAGQKAVLTSCVLINQSALSRKVKRSGNKGEREKAKQREDCMINVCLFFHLSCFLLGFLVLVRSEV